MRLRSTILVATAPVAMLAGLPLAAQLPLFDPVSGYRITQYRGVVDRVPEGVVRIGVAEAAARKGHAIFIDVTPAEGAVRDEDGVWHLAMPHATIPGARWFPEAGRGVQPPGVGDWFDRGVSLLTKGRRDRPIVIFCLADCWMSWNAALRIRRKGYARVEWFAEGIDGWREAGLALTPAKPAR